MAAAKMLTRGEVDSLLSLAKRYHDGEIKLPPEITTKKAEIAAATRNTELFMALTGAIDEGMVAHVVKLKLELDGLYARWV